MNDTWISVILRLTFSNSISLTFRFAALVFDASDASFFLDLVVKPIVDATALVFRDIKWVQFDWLLRWSTAQSIVQYLFPLLLPFFLSAHLAFFKAEALLLLSAWASHGGRQGVHKDFMLLLKELLLAAGVGVSISDELARRLWLLLLDFLLALLDKSDIDVWVSALWRLWRRQLSLISSVPPAIELVQKIIPAD